MAAASFDVLFPSAQNYANDRRRARLFLTSFQKPCRVFFLVFFCFWFFTKFFRALSTFSWFYRVFPSFTGFYLVFTGIYLVLLGFT